MKRLLMILSLILPLNVGANTYPYTPTGTLTKTDVLGPGDRVNSFPKYYIFNGYLSGFDINSDLYDRNIFLCMSATDTSTGACHTAGIGSLGATYGVSNISLQFTERRSLIKRNLILNGYKNHVFAGNASGCGVTGNMVLNSHVYSCSLTNGTTQRSNGTLLTLFIPENEINKLPFGGIWEATLVLKVKRYADFDFGTYTINITVHLTDKGNIQVWLPDFKNSPRVDLNLRPKGSGEYVGSNTLDMCLYDGYSTNSESMEIRFYDNSGQTGSNTYYLSKIGESSLKLPYSVSFLLGGRTLKPKNGQSFTINDPLGLEINWNRITAVSMPEINVPVLCWPAKLLFNANVKNPDAGQYKGHLNIIFTPSSENI
ncbi:CfaE/CblD family pilus tip adhesin [Citrobacter sp. S-77]|uniref:CfaE/CblD family pilus tip adhesin n=1 Tax=Citrobacter sp. S-77 TaxID=1080067 RepID=UPI0005F0722F|nr:CfaE/CblD family pilus tip adhesin [Citrobacter sp. S-77]